MASFIFMLFFTICLIFLQTIFQRYGGQGFIKINAIDQVDNLGAYVVGGYMSKKLDDPRYDGQKRYFSSRGLHESLEVKSALPIDLGEFTEDHKVYETSFENDIQALFITSSTILKRGSDQCSW